jgi:PPP family 3-phenylpropionic acid transporter
VERAIPLARATPRLKSVYFLFYGGLGANLSFFAPYLRGLGFSGQQIGRVQMVGSLAAAPAGLLWAIFADRVGALTGALRLAAWGSFAAVFLLPWVDSPTSVAVILMVNGLVQPAITPLLDSVTVESVRAQPELSYARVRLFGSLGFIVIVQLLGFSLALRGARPSDVAVPLTYVGCTLGYALVASTLPALEAPSSTPRLGETLALLKNPKLLLVLFAAAVHFGSTSPYYQLFGIFVRDHGFPPTVTSLGTGFGVLAEVAALFYFGSIEKRFALGTIMAIAFASASLRWFLLSRATTALTMVLLQGFHGITFGYYWGATVKALSKIVPSHLRATGQALFGAIAFSLGGAIGYPLAGYAYDHFGSAAPVYRCASLTELVPFGVALVLRAIAL